MANTYWRNYRHKYREVPILREENVVRNGHASNGKQKYLCKKWKRQTRENPTPHAYLEEDREKILKAYQERSSLRG